MIKTKLRKSVTSVLTIVLLALSFGVLAGCPSTEEEGSSDDVQDEIKDEADFGTL